MKKAVMYVATFLLGLLVGGYVFHEPGRVIICDQQAQKVPGYIEYDCREIIQQ